MSKTPRKTDIKKKDPEFSSDEERALYESSEQGEWLSRKDLPERKIFWKQVAENTIKDKRTRISLAVPDRDLARLKALALRKGIPYQTLINAILHDYAKTGDA
ncbi:MAG: DNA-binding protein [Hyphomicrobiaceae bacterium]|nr:DNA-binding protein [Hyphomicrobiaceae bacterium]